MSIVAAGSYVQVEFISESRTEFSGTNFKGNGVVDRHDDGYVYGRLDTGVPFMCPAEFVKPINAPIEPIKEFETWFETQDFYINMRFIHGDGLFAKDGDVYRVLPVQMCYSAYQEKAYIAEMNKRYIGKMQEQQDMIAAVENVIKQHDRYIPQSTVNALKKALRGESFLEYLDRAEGIAEEIPESVRRSVREGLGLSRGEHESD